MKKDYPIGQDMFIAAGFASFVIGSFLKLLGINELFWHITSFGLIKLSLWCLFFSIALSLFDIASKPE